MNDYVSIDGKKYKVSDLGGDSYKPVYDRQKTYDVGLTGKTIGQDFTILDRVPQQWLFTLRVFINDPWPDSEWGVWSDLLAASDEPYVDFIEHDGTTEHEVGIQRPLIPRPRTGANISGELNGIFFVDVVLIKVFR